MSMEFYGRTYADGALLAVEASGYGDVDPVTGAVTDPWLKLVVLLEGAGRSEFRGYTRELTAAGLYAELDAMLAPAGLTGFGCEWNAEFLQGRPRSGFLGRQLGLDEKQSVLLMTGCWVRPGTAVAVSGGSGCSARATLPGGYEMHCCGTTEERPLAGDEATVLGWLRA